MMVAGEGGGEEKCGTSCTGVFARARALLANAPERMAVRERTAGTFCREYYDDDDEGKGTDAPVLAAEKATAASISERCDNLVRLLLKREQRLQEQCSSAQARLSGHKKGGMRGLGLASVSVDPSGEMLAITEPLDPSLEDQEVVYNAWATTMTELKGRVVQLTNAHIAEIKVIIGQVRKAKDKLRVFKEAHMAIKAILTRKFGARICSCGRSFRRIIDPQAWPLQMPDLESFAPHELSAMLASIRKIIVAFDNMDLDERQRGNFQTYLEIAINKEWLFKIAAVAMQQKASRDRTRRTRPSTIMDVDADTVASFGSGFEQDNLVVNKSEFAGASPTLGAAPLTAPPPPPISSADVSRLKSIAAMTPSPPQAHTSTRNLPGTNMVERRRRASELRERRLGAFAPPRVSPDKDELGAPRTLSPPRPRLELLTKEEENKSPPPPPPGTPPPLPIALPPSAAQASGEQRRTTVHGASISLSTQLLFAESAASPARKRKLRRQTVLGL